MGQRVRRVIVAAAHRLGGDERVDDRLLCRLDRGHEQRIDVVVIEHPDGERRARTAMRRQLVARGETDEELAARVAPDRAGSRQTEAGPLGQPFALMRQERRVGRDHDDDRS